MPTVQYEGGQWKVTEERLWLVSWEKGVHDGQMLKATSCSEPREVGLTFTLLLVSVPGGSLPGRNRRGGLNSRE